MEQRIEQDKVNNLESHNIRLFVFGTLRKGCRLNFYMEGSRFLGLYYTRGQLMESSIGSAYIDFDDKNAATVGELYDVNYYCLKRIDHMESNWVEFPKGYELALLPVWPYDASQNYDFDVSAAELAFIYKRKEAAKVLSGDWTRRSSTIEEIGVFLGGKSDELNHRDVVNHFKGRISQL